MLRDGAAAVTLLALAALVWAALLVGMAGLLLRPGWQAAIGWIDASHLALPLIGRIDGAHLMDRLSEKLSMVAFAVLPVLLLGTAAVGVRDSSIWRLVNGRSISGWTDFGLYALNALGLWKYLTIALTFGLVLVANFASVAVVGAMAHLHLRIHTGWLVSDSILAFLVFTFCDYWNHRAQHRSPL